MQGPMLLQDKARPLPQPSLNNLNQQELYESEKHTEGVGNHLKEINQLDNTLVFISIGDKGAGKEGTLNGDIVDESTAQKAPSPF